MDLFKRKLKNQGKGVNTFDKVCHTVFEEIGQSGIYTDGQCKICGGDIKVYYCEELLYCVHCLGCGTVALVKARNPQIAADVTISDTHIRLRDVDPELAKVFDKNQDS